MCFLSFCHISYGWRRMNLRLFSSLLPLSNMQLPRCMQTALAFADIVSALYHGGTKVPLDSRFPVTGICQSPSD